MRAAVRRKRAKRQSRRNQILHTPESTSMSEYVRRMRPVAPLPDRAPLCCSALRRRGLSVYLATVGISRKPTVKMNNDRWAGDGAPACHCLQRLRDAVGLRDAVERNANAAVPERGHRILPVLRQHALILLPGGIQMHIQDFKPTEQGRGFVRYGWYQQSTVHTARI